MSAKKSKLQSLKRTRALKRSIMCTDGKNHAYHS